VTLSELGQVFHSCVIEEWVQLEDVLGIPVLGVPRPWRGGTLSFESVHYLWIAQVHVPQPASLWLFADAAFAKAANQCDWGRVLFEKFQTAINLRWGAKSPQIHWLKDYSFESWKNEWTEATISQGLRFPIESANGSVDLGLCVFFQS